MPEYIVEKGPVKLLDEFRGDRIYGDTYIIFKDGAPHYEVTFSTLGEWCNCPAGVHHGKCKHINMVLEYRKELENDQRR